MSPKRVRKEEEEVNDYCRTAIVPCVVHLLTVPSTSMFWRWNVIATESTLSRSWMSRWISGQTLGRVGAYRHAQTAKGRGRGVKEEKRAASLCNREYSIS